MSAPITMPFKGECFPAYVVQRITRRPSGKSQGYAQPVCSVVNNDDAHTVPRYDERRLSAGGYHTQTGGAVSTTAVTVVKPSSVVMFTQSKLSLRSHRPSLSEQLKTISHGAETITTQLRSAYLADARASTSIQQRSGSNWTPSSKPSDGKVLEATTVHLSVGRLDCRFPCPVHFSFDHCSYLFQHPFESKEIQMVMFYRDMRSLQINVRERCMRFRVDRVLEHFGDDYRPSNPQHNLRIIFATESEAMKVKRFLGKLKPGYFEVVAALDEHNRNQAH